MSLLLNERARCYFSGCQHIMPNEIDPEIKERLDQLGIEIRRLTKEDNNEYVFVYRDKYIAMSSISLTNKILPDFLKIDFEIH